jgi:isoquinoline 1-oxidoreductase subunit alpha
MPKYQISINGEQKSFEAEPEMPLLWALRDRLGLVGTKYGCGIGQCGSCTVHVNGVATRSCQLPISAIGNAAVRTIEGLATGSNLHVLQQSWIDHDVAQCGYCQAGQIMSAAALLEQKPNPTDADIDTAMAGNYCRCGTYIRIRKAIHAAAELKQNTAFYDAANKKVEATV